MRPLRAKWFLEIHNGITSAIVREVCLKDWKVASITDAVDHGILILPALDPFEDLHGIMGEKVELQTVRSKSH